MHGNVPVPVSIDSDMMMWWTQSWLISPDDDLYECPGEPLSQPSLSTLDVFLVWIDYCQYPGQIHTFTMFIFFSVLMSKWKEVKAWQAHGNGNVMIARIMQNKTCHNGSSKWGSLLTTLHQHCNNLDRTYSKLNKIRKIYKFAFHVDKDHKINYL